MTQEILIVGAGGHGRVVLDILRAAGHYTPIGFLDADPGIAGTSVGGVPVLGQINQLPRLQKQKRVSGGIIAIGDNRTRLSYSKVLAEHGVPLVNAIHPSAVVSTSVSLGRNVVICAGAVVGADARIGDSVIINSSAVVEHECELAAGVHVAPGALLAGRVRVGEGAFIGLGANVIQCLSVGEHATVGAGAVVIRDVPPHATVVGTPARIIKTAPSS